MEALYVVPATLLALAAAGLAATVHVAAGEARDLAQALAGLADLRPALVRARSEVPSGSGTAGVRRRR